MALSRSLALCLACIPAIGLYWLTFLRQPVVEGAVEFTRAAFVLGSLLVPETIISTWTGSGRLETGGLDRWPIVLATLLWVCLPWLAFRQTGSITNKLFHFSLTALGGLAIFSTVTLVVGLAGGLHTRLALLIALMVSLAVLHRWTPQPLDFFRSWMRQRSVTPLINQPVRETQELKAGAISYEGGVISHESRGPFERALRIAAVALTLGCAAVIMLGAWVPPAEFDVLEYHLQAPKEFFQQGRITFVPHNIYANMPLGIEMHSLAAMTLLQIPDAWLGGLIGKSISASISLLGAMLLGTWIAKRSGGLAGWWSAGIWLATPGIAHVAMQGLIDGALATYCLATAICSWQLIEATNDPKQHEYVFLWSWRTALLGGATAAIKYPGLIFATLPCLLVIAWCMVKLAKRGEPRSVTKLITIVAISLSITCVPWYIKNWVLAGNPVYPLAANLFGGQTLNADKIAQWQTAHKVPPATMLASDATRVLMTSSFVQPAMVLGLAIALVWLLQREQRKSWRMTDSNAWYLLLAWSLWVLAVWWLATHRIDRFWLPLTGMWAGLAAWGLIRLSRDSLWLAHAIVLPGLLYGAMINCSPIVSDNRYFVSLASLRDDVGNEETPPRVPLAQGWIHQHLDAAAAKILLIGEARVFEYRPAVVYSTCFDTNPGEAMLVGKSPQDQRAALKRAGITHLMVNWQEINRYRSPGNYGFSQWPQREDIQALVDSGVVKPVDWDLEADRAQLLEVNPP